MRLVKPAILAVVFVTLAGPAARAQEVAMPEPEGEEEQPEAIATAPMHPWGAGLRLRYVFIPTSLLNLFLDHSTPMSNTGFGLEAVRRKGDFDVSFGLEYENVSPSDGLYLEQGDNPSTAGQYPDYTEFDGLALLGLDISFIWHVKMHPKIHLRYGAGIGVGIVLGDVYQTDTQCAPGTTADNLDEPGRCNKLTPPQPAGVQIHDLSDSVPPVVPIVNLLLGVRFNVTDQISINLEGGFRDMFFFGLGSSYFF